VVPNPPERTQTVQGEDWSLDLVARQPDGRPAPLTSDGAIDATSGGSVLVSGTGFAPGSVINVFLIDPSQSLATLTVGADGTFSGSVPIPPGLTPGRYVVQANGTTTGAQVRSTSVGVLIGAPVSTRRAVLRTTVYFDVRSAALDTKALRKVARLAGRVPDGAQIVRIRSVGYVQPESFTGNDQRLSTKRARNVVRQLRKDGVRGPTVIRGNGQAKQSGAKARRATVTVVFRVTE
jgi:outer membrane protein OmpA-like peptidoglycan-associated protein